MFILLYDASQKVKCPAGGIPSYLTLFLYPDTLRAMDLKRIGSFLFGKTPVVRTHPVPFPLEEPEISAFVQRSTVNRAHSFVELINGHMQQAHAAKII